jgi:uncharacterized protein YukE
MAGVTPLAVFAHDWAGGDIRGLQGVAQALYAYVPHVQDLAGGLSVAARDLTGDSPGAWQGQAASAFTAAWQRQAMTAAALEEYVTAVAVAIGGLAVELSQIESALEQQAYAVSAHGVRIGAGGTVEGYSGAQGPEWAQAYLTVREQALSEAASVREAAARQLYSLCQQVTNANPHPNVGDAVTMGGLLADLLVGPTAARREVGAELKKLTGEGLNLKEEIANAKGTGKLLPQETFDESVKVKTELQEVQEELGKTGRTEIALGKLLDTRVSDVRDFLAGEAGPGRHVGGNTPKDLQAAAEDDPGGLGKILNFGDAIPVVDIGTTLLATAVGTYYDVRGGQSVGSALAGEALSNTVGTVAANAAGSVVGTEIGSELGAAGGPVGIAVGTIVGYGVGSLTQNLLTEPWGQDTHTYGAALGTLYGIGHSEAATVDGARELAVGTGHKAEHYWDDLFG